MLFSSPDYPIFLIAVFFLYGLARWGGRQHAWARYAVMVLLGDIVFLLVAKNPDVLWDPIGGTLLRLVGGAHDWPPELLLRYAVGGVVLGGAISIGRRHGEWIASPRGQQRIAFATIGLVLGLATVAIVARIESAAPPPRVVFDTSWPVWFADWIRPHAFDATWPTWFADFVQQRNALDELTFHVVQHGHLLLLGVLGVGLGASRDRRRPLGRVVILFVVSAMFYHAWAAAMPGLYRYLLLLLLSTIVLDFYLGLWIERTTSPGARLALLIVSLCSNLGVLFFFKYYNFFVEDVVGLGPSAHLDLILPAGISFHTFQSLSYTIDVYRKQLPATRSAVQFATFVLFFPQLVAGPIVRAHDLLPQLADPPPLEMSKATEGLFRIVVGLFKKIALADTLALAIVDRVFENPGHFSSIEVLCGIYAYALQIYLDFSAYSDIAIGSAQILGFELPENFNTPYRSANLQEFWRRWHISLSTWLRDYLYIAALGGSRGAEWRTYLNLTLTMLLGGLWHGASWAFIVWGGLHGFGLAITRYFQRATARDLAAGWRLVAVCGMFGIVGVTFLRSPFAPDGTWSQLVIAWLALTPLWAVTTAWLGGPWKPPAADPSAAHSAAGGERSRAAATRDAAALALRVAMCVAGAGLVVELRYAETWTWIPTVLAMWAFGIAADVVEYGPTDRVAGLIAVARRALSIFLVFHYVCLAWIFFRAESFERALEILRRLAERSTDHANLVPTVTGALAVGFVCHFFAGGSFAWLRRVFVAMPTPIRGLVLVVVALVLRQLANHDIVPFIYFQF